MFAKQPGREGMVPGPKTHKKTKHQSCVLMNLSRYVWDQIFQDHVRPFIGNGKILKKFRKGDSVCLGWGEVTPATVSQTRWGRDWWQDASERIPIVLQGQRRGWGIE